MALYLQFLVSLLKIFNFWPENTRFSCLKMYFIPVTILVTTAPILGDLLLQVQETDVELTRLNENLVAFSALLGVTYVSFCFINHQRPIRDLVFGLVQFQQFCPLAILEKVDNSVKFYTRVFIIYAILGNICYGLLPVLTFDTCQEQMLTYMHRNGIPCGLVVRFLLPVKFDYFPLAQIVAVYEIVICTLCSTITIVMTMLVCGVLRFVTSQMQYLGHLLKSTDAPVKFCVKYHITLINYATRVDRSFNQMMLLHITWTGFIISILGFEMTTTTNFIEALRFGMHLAGWLLMLFTVCYSGQGLLDQSEAIATRIYNYHWYNAQIPVQKSIVLVILRSQKALTLNACGLKVMSFSTFLGVMYTAYSYFTLLLKLKS